MADEKNMELNDESLEEAAGGITEEDERGKKPDPKYETGDRVNVRGKLWLGVGRVYRSYYENGSWWYDLHFENSYNDDVYGRRLKETAIYGA